MTTSTIRLPSRQPRLSKTKKCIIAALWLAIWQGAYLAVGEDLLLVSPFAVFRRVLELLAEPDFWAILSHSCLRIGLGFALGLVTGCLLAAATAFSANAYAFVSLPMAIVKATPVASFIILALVWITGENLSVFISFLMVLPLVWTNLHQGICSVDPKLLEMAHVFALSPAMVLRHIYFPAVLPHFLSAVQVALGFAWKSGIAGEVLAVPRNAIGTQLYNAKVYLETEDLFAWSVVIILVSFAIEKLLLALIRRASGTVGGGKSQ